MKNVISTLFILFFLLGCKQEMLDISPSKTNEEKEVGVGTSDKESLPAPLLIRITPENPEFFAGNKIGFTATGIYAYDNQEDLTDLVEWDVSDESFAQFAADENFGVLETILTGEITINATFKDVLGSTVVKIVEPNAKNIFLTPSVTEVVIDQDTSANPVSKKIDFIATGIYSNHTVTEITKSAKWSTSDKNIAKIGKNGAVTFLQGGNVTISVTHDEATLSQAIKVKVEPITLKSMTFSTSPIAIPLGGEMDIVLTGTYSNGAVADVSELASWTSDDDAVFTVDNTDGNKGHVISTGIGASMLSASLDGLTLNANFITTAAVLESIAISPENTSTALGIDLNFSAVGSYSDGTDINITSSVNWNSDAPGVGMVSNIFPYIGIFTSGAIGVANISAELGGVSETVPTEITIEEISNIIITAPSQSYPKGRTGNFTAAAEYTNGNVAVSTEALNWSSSNPTVLSVSNTGGTKGQITAVQIGNAFITASNGVLSTQIYVDVVSPVADAISVAPAIGLPTLAFGLLKQYQATATLSDGTTTDYTEQCDWSIDVISAGNSYAAGVSDAPGTKGLITTVAIGKTGIVAEHNGLIAAADITITEKEIVNIAVTGASSTLTINDTQQMTATATYTDGTTQNVTDASGDADLTMVWASTDTIPQGTVLVMDNVGTPGEATANIEGGSNITATITSVKFGVFSDSFPAAVQSECVSGTRYSYYCVYMTVQNENCNTICTNNAATYHGGTDYVFGAGAPTAEACQGALMSLGFSGLDDTDGSNVAGGIGCSAIELFGSDITARVDSPATNATDTAADIKRMCACTQ